MNYFIIWITIVGWLRIAWDKNKAIYPYRYGSNPYENDKYDVMICDEPRILEGELIDPGCLVTRGTYIHTIILWFVLRSNIIVILIIVVDVRFVMSCC